MTTCSHFWKNTRSNADKLFGINNNNNNNNNNNDNSNTNNDNTPLQGALSVRDAFRRILSSDVFPHLHSNRSVLVHAALSGASEDTMHFLMEKGAPVVHESEPQTFSVLVRMTTFIVAACFCLLWATSEDLLSWRAELGSVVACLICLNSGMLRLEGLL